MKRVRQILVCLVLLLAWTESQAQGIKWSQEGLLGELPTALTTAVVQGKQRVFIGASLPTQWNVQAFDATLGTVLWQDETAASGANGSSPLVLAADSARVAAAGVLDGMMVRVYDASTGAVLWTDQGARDGPLGTCHQARAVAITATRIFAGGCKEDTPFVRAYTLEGTIAWTIMPGPRGEQVIGIHPWRNILFVVLESGRSQGVQQSTGARLWETPPVENARMRASAYGNVGVSGYLAMTGEKADTPGDWQNARSYTQVVLRRTAKVLWRHVGAPQTMGTAVTVADRIYVGGGTRVTTQGILRVHQPSNGQVLWEKQGPEASDGNEGENWIAALAVDTARAQVYAANALMDLTAGMAWPDAGIRAYKTSTGSEQWLLQQDGALHVWDGTTHLALAGGVLYSLGVRDSQLFETPEASWHLEALTPTRAPTLVTLR